ncbi:hypothetical protein Ancab_019167 [Ancistrocladus abbreviatus]
MPETLSHEVAAACGFDKSQALKIVDPRHVINIDTNITASRAYLLGQSFWHRRPEEAAVVEAPSYRHAVDPSRRQVLVGGISAVSRRRRGGDGNCLFTASRKAMAPELKVDARNLRRRTVNRFLEDLGSLSGKEREND